MGKLASYHAKRKFDVTPEPAGDRPSARAQPEWIFVVQKHAARRLHYDFRLELDGVLLSWAVPKGPSLRAGEKRLAARTEDHPLEYASFEGIIPAGQYGGGTVVVWDRGTWQPEGDPREGMKKGRLTFTLAGEKLTGRWHLVRTKADSWLLFKGKDDAASAEDVVAARPESVLSGRTVEEVAAAPHRVWQSNRAESPFTSLDKVLWPGDELTKGDLIAYLSIVAEPLLHHAARRPLTLVRCPEGRKKKCFFQKHAPGKEYIEISDERGLLDLAQLGVMELHLWGAHMDTLEKPDRLVFDLDPDPAVGWDAVVAAALAVRARLHDEHLESFVMTTGGKGLHVVAPVTPKVTWETFKKFARALAERLAAAHPKRYTANPLKAQRKGKIFVDYLRNARGASAIAPYSPRAREGATVATPLTWKELEAGVDPQKHTILTVPKRLSKLTEEPWDEYDALRQVIRTR